VAASYLPGSDLKNSPEKKAELAGFIVLVSALVVSTYLDRLKLLGAHLSLYLFCVLFLAVSIPLLLTGAVSRYGAYKSSRRVVHLIVCLVDLLIMIFASGFTLLLLVGIQAHSGRI